MTHKKLTEWFPMATPPVRSGAYRVANKGVCAMANTPYGWVYQLYDSRSGRWHKDGAFAFYGDNACKWQGVLRGE